MREFFATGDFNAVGRAAAEARRQLVECVVEDVRSGRADLTTIAEFVVDAALARAARCAQGESGIYSELWSLDEGRASVAAMSSKAGDVKAAAASASPGVAGTVTRMLAAKDIVIDERPREADAPPRPLFAVVQPHVLARPTALALLEVFEVFRRRGAGAQGAAYAPGERGAIERLLDAVDRTPVMRRARAEAAKLRGEPWTDEAWRAAMWRVWFDRSSAGRGCGFEHVFVGEASQDQRGREVVGGLHNWFKFYLEEQRGAAKYLGVRYTGRTKDMEAALLNPHFVSGRFTWDLDGRHLVKDVGGFFVGVSPEWQMAVATVAYFETETPERAAARQWSRDAAATFDVGYTRAARLGEQVYRLVVRRSEAGGLTTFFAAQLGTWDARARAELDQTLSTAELERRLPAVLVLHGFADEPELLACAARIGAAGAFTLREALRHLHAELAYGFDGGGAPAEQEAGAGLAIGDLQEVAAELVSAYDDGVLSSGRWGELLQRLRERTGRKRRRLFRPMRWALTGRLQGHDLREFLRLLELLEAGAPWSREIVPLQRRIGLLREWLAAGGVASVGVRALAPESA